MKVELEKVREIIKKAKDVISTLVANYEGEELDECVEKIKYIICELDEFEPENLKYKYLNHITKDGELGFHEGIIFVSDAILKNEYLNTEQLKAYISSFKNISTEIKKLIKTEACND